MYRLQEVPTWIYPLPHVSDSKSVYRVLYPVISLLESHILSRFEQILG